MVGRLLWILAEAAALSVLIAIEGIDGSGKGTQAARLHSYFSASGRTTALLSFPQYQVTAFGRKIGDFLNGRFGDLDSVHPLLVSLLFAGDRFESRTLIEQALSNHEIVICDRYIASNMAHQAAKCCGPDRRDLIEWIAHLETKIYGLPTADLTLFLDVPVPQAQQLIAAKSRRSYTDKAADLQEADGHYLEKVREVYQLLCRQPGWHQIACVESGQVRQVEDITNDLIAAITNSISH